MVAIAIAEGVVILYLWRGHFAPSITIKCSQKHSRLF